jgi:hypothetical protein
VPLDDPARVRAVGDHLQLLARSLHGHHSGEDALLWDELSSRNPGCSVHVALMRRQHAEIAEALAALESAAPRWQAAPSPATRDAVLEALDAVLAGLGTHLPDEERLILPPAGAAFSQREWDRLGGRARTETPRNVLFVQLGFLLDALEPGERVDFERNVLPAPARLLFRLIGRRQYRDYRRKVYGTAA